MRGVCVDQCSQRGSLSILSQDEEGRLFVVPSRFLANFLMIQSGGRWARSPPPRNVVRPRTSFLLVGHVDKMTGRDDKTSSVLVLAQDGRTAPLRTLLISFQYTGRMPRGASSNANICHLSPDVCYRTQLILSNPLFLTQTLSYPLAYHLWVIYITPISQPPPPPKPLLLDIIVLKLSVRFV